MPKITTEQVKKINSKCSNGWRLDLEYFAYHGEKQLMKCIELDKESYLKFTIRYNNENQSVLRINKFYHKQGDYFAHSEGLGKETLVNSTPTKKKEINKLIRLTPLLTDTELIEINKITPVLSGGGIFVPSKDF